MKILNRFTLLFLVMSFLIGLCATTAFAAGPTPKIVIPIQKTFYLSDIAVNGNGTSGQCAAGYHFASIWEIWELSPLAYNTVEGKTPFIDQGEGPPAYFGGWVRSGWTSDAKDNCNNWTSISPTDTGIVAHLNLDQLFNESKPWRLERLACGPSGTGMFFVWCVSDAVY
jgi:hypothetical protein